MAFVQGFLASITLDSNDITLVSTDVTLAEARTVLEKSVMDGTGASQSLPGLKSGELTMNGHVDQANLNLLETTWAKDTVVPFSMVITEGLGTDGQYAGNVAISAFEKSAGFDGNWAFSMTATTSGAVVYTPSVA